MGLLQYVTITYFLATTRPPIWTAPLIRETVSSLTPLVFLTFMRMKIISAAVISVSLVWTLWGGVTVFKFVTKNEVEESFLVIVRYGLKYFNMKNVDAVQFWGQIMSLQDDHLQWKPVLLLIEVCPCAPHSNATLEKLLWMYECN